MGSFREGLLMLPRAAAKALGKNKVDVTERYLVNLLQGLYFVYPCVALSEGLMGPLICIKSAPLHQVSVPLHQVSAEVV